MEHVEANGHDPIGAVFREDRKRRGMSLRAYGKFLGVSHYKICKIEAGYVTLRWLRRLALSDVVEHRALAHNVVRALAEELA